MNTVGWSYTAAAALVEDEILFLKLIGEFDPYAADDFNDQSPCMAPLNCIKSKPFWA